MNPPLTFYHTHTEDPRYMQTYRITLCGSMRKYLPLFNEVIQTAKSYQIDVLSPQPGKKVSEIDGFIRTEGDPKLSDVELEMHHLRQIYESNLILVLNPGGRIGATTFSEILYARFFDKPILFLERPTNDQEKLVKDIVSNSPYQRYLDMQTTIENKLWEVRRIVHAMDKRNSFAEKRFDYIPSTESLVRTI